MHNKEKYVPWSSRLLLYAKRIPNEKLIYNSIINGPYVRRMIPKPSDLNHEVPVPETPSSSPWGASVLFFKKKDISLRMCIDYRELDKLMNKKEHEEHLRTILKLLKKEELYAKFSKCEFWIPKVQFIDHVINGEGIHVDPAKIESVKDWVSPKSPTEIH
nr:putative reverse transcriptase domain-containing protein [Tanacetum cinerariifolium]